MYTDFYHFRKMPFSPKADAEFFYLSDNHETGLAVLANGLANGVAVNVILGASGIGKTTLIRYLLNHFQQDCAVCFIDKTVRSGLELLRSILTGFEQGVDQAGKEHLKCRLVNFLESQSKRHNQPSLLIIDDAHNLSVDALKTISELSTLRLEQRQQLQLVLVGQDQLMTVLEGSELEEFAKRIGTLCYLEPLSLAETTKYIRYRLKVAGGEAEALFDENACSAIYDYSQGNPELINALCDDALVYGSALKKTAIDAKLVKFAANGNLQWEEESPAIGTRNDAPADNGVSLFARFDRFFKTALVTASISIGVASMIGLFLDPEPLSTNQPSSSASLGLFSKSDPLEVSDIGAMSSLSDARSKDNPVSGSTPAKSPDGKNRLENALAKTGARDAGKLDGYRFKDEDLDRSSARNKEWSPSQGAATSSGAAIDERLGQLFLLAEQKVGSANLVFPENDSAFAIFTRILEISPNNPRAIAGLDKIADKYLGWAQARRAEGELKRSQLFITRGLGVRPEHRGLIELEKQMASELRDRESQANAVEALAKQAGQQVASLRLTLPEGENAYETYQEIFAIDKNNQQAVDGVRDIPLQLESLITSALEKRDYGSALAFAEQAVNIGHEDLSNENQEKVITAAMEAKKIIGTRIDTMLAQARSHFDAQRLVLPPDANAFQAYHKVLEIDPKNQAARNGLDDIAKRFGMIAKSEFKDGNVEQALMFVEAGLKAFPGNAELRAVLNRIDRKRESAPGSVVEGSSREVEAEGDGTKNRVRSFVTF